MAMFFHYDIALVSFFNSGWQWRHLKNELDEKNSLANLFIYYRKLFRDLENLQVEI